MHTYVKYRKECGERVVLFCAQPGITLTPLETTLVAGINTKVTGMQSWGVDQISGNLAFRDGVQDRKTTASRTREKMRSITEIAKSLELAGTPGITAIAFRMPEQRSYAVLAAAANAFAENATPHKAKFIEFGLATTFVEDLEALATQLKVDSQAREAGRFEQTGGTAGLEALADECLKLIQQMRPIMRQHLKDSPALLGAWKLASRVQSSRDRKPAEGGESGTGSTPPAGS